MDRGFPPGLPRQFATAGRIPLAVVVVDGDGLVSHWSMGARRLFGHSRDEAVGQQAGDLMPVAGALAGDERGVAHGMADGADGEGGAGPGLSAGLGTRGRAFVVELTPGSKDVLQSAAEEPDGPPEKLRRGFDHGLKPAGATDEEVPDLLGAAGLRTLASGETALPMTEHLSDGTRIDLPARWFVLAPA